MNYDQPSPHDRMLAGLLRPGTHDDMVRSAVRLAKLAFSAAASSVFLYDETRDALVFEASSGAGEDRIAGVAVPSDRGIAGWVFHSGETVIADDVAADARFDREFAAWTGYVPRSIMAAPLEFEETVIGVIEVLDPVRDRFGDIPAIDLLTELAAQCASALSLLVAIRGLQARGGGAESQPPGDWNGQEVARTLAQTPPAAIHELIRALDSLSGPSAWER